MKDKIKMFLGERGIATNEMIEGAYGSAYYLEGMLETFAKEETKTLKIEKDLLGGGLSNAVDTIKKLDQRINELEEGLRECEEVLDQLEEGSMCKYIKQLLNQNTDEDTKKN